MIFFGKYFWWAHGGSTWGADIDGGYRPVYGVIAATRLMFIKKFSAPHTTYNTSNFLGKRVVNAEIHSSICPSFAEGDLRHRTMLLFYVLIM